MGNWNSKFLRNYLRIYSNSNRAMSVKISQALTEHDAAEIINRDSDKILCHSAAHQNNHDKTLKKIF
jgi:hypothetical protein